MKAEFVSEKILRLISENKLENSLVDNLETLLIEKGIKVESWIEYGWTDYRIHNLDIYLKEDKKD